MNTAIVMLHFGEKTTTKDALKALKKKIHENRLILINNTQDTIDDLVKIIPNTSLISNNRNAGFAKAVNQGIETALKDKSIDSVFLMNNDLELSFGNIEMLRKTLFGNDAVGIVSPTLHHSKELYDWGGRINKCTGNAKHQNFKQKPKRVIEVDHVAGAAMLIKRELFDRIGRFDEIFFLYFEDVDFCLRGRKAGYRVLIDPEVVAEHILSKSSSPIPRIIYQWQSHIKFIAKHMPVDIYPTAILYDVVFYPLVIIKLLLKSILR